MRKIIVGFIIASVLVTLMVGKVFAGKPSVIEVLKDPKGKAPIVKHLNSYEDGTYRGFFADRGDIQVALQFVLKNNKIENINFRQLFHSGTDYRTETEDPVIIGLREQHEQLIEYLIGKDVRISFSDLYEPGNIVFDEVEVIEDGQKVDAFTGTTLRSGKIISAIRDALNRGVYRY